MPRWEKIVGNDKKVNKNQIGNAEAAIILRRRASRRALVQTPRQLLAIILRKESETQDMNKISIQVVALEICPWEKFNEGRAS
jgi:hypothetical protein